MKTRNKLSLIVVTIGLVLSLVAIFLAVNSLVAYRTVRTVAPTLEMINLLSQVRTRLHRQQRDLAHFVVAGELAIWQESTIHRSAIEEALRRLSAAVEEQTALGIPGEEEVGVNINHLAERYRQYLLKVESCVQQKKTGRLEEALLNLDKEVTPFFETEILPLLNRLDREEILEVTDAYRIITRNFGALPWVAGVGLQQVELAMTGVDYDLAVSNTEVCLYRQIAELTEFLLHEEPLDWEEFLGYRFEMRRLFEEWHQVIVHQQAQGGVGEDEDAEQLKAVGAEYEGLLPQMEKAVAVRRAQGRVAGLEYVEHHLEASFDRLFSSMTVAGKGSREEIAELHQGLRNTLMIGGFIGLFCTAVLSGLILLLAIRMSNGIVSSLRRLRDGTELIKGGDLEHQIRLGGDDEFSELAAAFNAMTLALKEHNEELRAFVFSIAHDLRAPLVNLKGFSKELRVDLAGATPTLLLGLGSLSKEERRDAVAVLEQAVPEALAYIDSSTSKLDSLINAVLHVSRIDFQTLNPEAIDMEELVQQALQNFAGTIKDKGIEVGMGPLPAVVADRLVMEQCVANLLDNAFKYLDPGRAGLVSITAEREGEQMVFCVADNGRGIAPDDLPRVFEIFRRAGQQDRPGEGIGLAFVKALARRQGGNVRCESTLGEGATFYLAVPAGD